jgi:hypothetical protein
MRPPVVKGKKPESYPKLYLFSVQRHEVSNTGGEKSFGGSAGAVRTEAR